MRGLWWCAAVAAAGLLGSADARADAGAGLELPPACAWTGGGPAVVQTLSCPSANGPAQPVIVSGLTPDTVGRARAGDSAAIRNIARFYMFGPPDLRDPSRAIALFEAAAAKGDTRAMLTLAVIYRNGVSVPRDNSQAAAWYRKAAEAGSPEGMYYLASAYASASGLPQDDGAALKWHRASADKGYGAAMAAIGVMYFAGKGLPQDYGQAAAWFAKAGDAGAPQGLQYLAYLYDKGLGVKQDKARARALNAQFQQLYGMTAMPTQHELARAFPVEAAVAGVEGRAVYGCRLGEDRALEDCILESETPASLGFGAAGFSIIPKMRLGPGLATGAEFNLPIRFALPTGVVGNREHAEQCAAEGLALRKRGALGGDAEWWARYWLAMADYEARQAGEKPAPDRWEAAVDAAAQRISLGKDSGLFGLINRCSLN